MKKIALIINDSKDKGFVMAKKVIDFMQGKADIFVDKSCQIPDASVTYVSSEDMYDKADYAVVLGGDGTILQKAAYFAGKKIPVMGINLGKIGFMTEIEPSDAEDALNKLLSGDFKTEKRMMIKARITRAGGETNTFHALNDIVISKSMGENLICTKLYSDGKAVNSYIADGLIIATPTGSTGYSVSAGGPVVDPGMRLLVATPICAHTLSARSAVLPAGKTIKIKIDSAYGGQEAVVTADGGIQGGIKDGDEVLITESEYDFELIKIGHQSFYDTLISKLS